MLFTSCSIAFAQDFQTDSVITTATYKPQTTKFRPLGSSYSRFCIGLGSSFLQTENGVESAFDGTRKPADFGSGAGASILMNGFYVFPKGLFLGLDGEMYLPFSADNYSLGVSIFARAGYEVWKGPLSVTPNLGYGFAYMGTNLEGNITEDYQLINDVIFIGPNASNNGRGAGRNIGMGLSYFPWYLRPSVRFGYWFGRCGLYGEPYVSIALGDGNPKLSFSGTGYYSAQQFTSGKDAPRPVSTDYVYNITTTPLIKNNRPYTGSPYKINGAGINLGFIMKWN
ncbi:MAG: hypothetical protein V4543_17565 [Bacteroidota bacterium]